MSASFSDTQQLHRYCFSSDVNPMNTLHLSGVSFGYPGHTVITETTQHWQAGLVWLHGQNGSGKSSVLKTLAGAQPALSGQLILNGMTEKTDPVAYRQQLFYVGSDDYTAVAQRAAMGKVLRRNVPAFLHGGMAESVNSVRHCRVCHATTQRTVTGHPQKACVRTGICLPPGTVTAG
jgi:ABC-type cobalamin/Fe3+-siderophores transport system ATPase subunit